MRTFDAVICGGGLAGAATARELVGRGFSALVCEREPVPRFKPGEIVGPNAAPFIDAFGLTRRFRDDRRLAIPCAGVRSDWGAHGEDRRLFLFEPGGRGFAVDRALLDGAVRGEAVAAGAEWLAGAGLQDVERRRDGWLVGVRTPDGAQSLFARTLVDATGRAASLARRLGARRLRAASLVAIHARRIAETEVPEETTLCVAALPGGWRYEVAVPDGHAVCLVTDAAALSAQTGNSREKLLAVLLGDAGLSGTGLRAARSGDVRAFEAGAAALVQEDDDPWLAVGDAAACFDPLSSQGVAHAFASARSATDAIGDRLGGDRNAFLAHQSRTFRLWRRTLADLADIYRAARFETEGFYRRSIAALKRPVPRPRPNDAARRRGSSLGDRSARKELDPRIELGKTV